MRTNNGKRNVSFTKKGSSFFFFLEKDPEGKKLILSFY